MKYRRLIFTLLYDSGSFVLSRNFRLQKVGDDNWLKRTYNFQNISHSIDELIVLDVTREHRNTDKFLESVKRISLNCFIPIALGGGVNDSPFARKLMQSGADKLVVNTALFNKPKFVRELVSHYGSQSIIGSIDYKEENQGLYVYTNNGTEYVGDLSQCIDLAIKTGVGELYLTSMSKDGTGQGMGSDKLGDILKSVPIPVILSGGAGNFQHLIDAFETFVPEAVSTANLFNFIGNGLPNARTKLIESGVNIPYWPAKMEIHLHNYLKNC